MTKALRKLKKLISPRPYSLNRGNSVEVSDSLSCLLDRSLMLHSKLEIELAKNNIKSLGIEGHHDKSKNWDLYLSLMSVESLHKSSRILDAGSGSKAVFAKSAISLGYKNVYACDLQEIHVKGVTKSKCDITKTPYSNGFFDAIACLSVIEHGVNLQDFSDEMFRICKPGGKLIVSTDFWPEDEDYSDRFPYGQENSHMKICSNKSIQKFREILVQSGWSLSTYSNFKPVSERPIHWERMNAKYTFLWFTATKKYS